jgi:glycosyltransferase involved in cell wall biosynthesis
MFIEPATSKRFLLAPAERNRGPTYRLPEDIALRWSAGRVHNGFYKHLAPLEPEHHVIGPFEERCYCPTMKTTRPLRILVAHNVPGARTGGMSRTMGFIHDQLAQAGHTIDYFCAEEVPPRFQGRLARFAFPLLVRRFAIAAARAGRPYDIVNVHEPGAAAISKYKRAAGNPIVVAMSYGVERRGWDLRIEEMRLGRESISLKTRFVYPLTSLWQSKIGFLNADHIFCKNTEDRNYLVNWLNLSPEKITRISPGADPIYATAARGRSYRRMEKLLFAGTWIKRKGTIDLIAAFSYLAERYPSLQLTVLGSGVAEEVIRNDFASGIRERVHCLNTLNEEATAQAFADADIYLLPSLFEGTPLTLLEAMMSGLPIITTSICGMLDTIENERNGLLVPVRSPESISKACERLINNEELRARIGLAAQADAVNKYTWDQVAAPVQSVYERLSEARQMTPSLQVSSTAW